MGRLFWKFFAFVWLAQIAGIVAIGSAFWLTQRHGESAVDIDPGPGFAAAREPGAGDPPGRPRESLEPRPLGPPGMAGPRGPRDLLGGRLRGLPLLPTLSTLIGSFLTALLLAWYVAKPIRSLRTAFDGVAGGDLGRRVTPSIGRRQDELADLGRDFDRMAERLQVAMEGQRRLLHDVSHEVRSPLARLQAAVGLLRRKYVDEDQTVERIEEEIVRIDRLVGDLLKLSRIEAGEMPGIEEEVDLHELVAEIVADANFEAEASGRSIVCNDGAAAMLRGRPDILRVAVENIVRNALKHAPQSRDITLETAVDPARAVYTIRILDSGPGVPSAELAHMFTPFFRSAQAAGTDGYGLGLAIARRSVEAHGGRITATNRKEGGLSVAIELPLSRGAASAPHPTPLA